MTAEPGAVSTSRVKLSVTSSVRQAPDSVEVSSAFPSAMRSRAVTDWVMVCSSGLIARAVTHSAKRRNPNRVKAQAKGFSSACQIDQRSVACDASWGLSCCGAGGEENHPAGTARETPRSIRDRGTVGV